MSFVSKLNEVAVAKSRIAALEKKVMDERDVALSTLHAQYGYSDLKSFVKALKTVSRSRGGKRAPKPKAEKVASKRGRLSAEAKQSLVEALREGKKAAEVASAFGVSIATVNVLKKQAGLVKEHKRLA